MNVLIVLNYNDFETTEKFILQIKDYNILDGIVIVDNCSTDNSYKMLQKFKSEKIDVISTNRNDGYASGNNFGVRFADEKYNPVNLIISNPDIIVSETSILNIFKHLDANENVAAVGALISDSQNKIVKNFAWKLPNFNSTILSTSLSINKISEKLFQYKSFYTVDKTKDISYINVDVLSGCFFAIKNQVFKEVGYFDERTFLFCEENILAFKLNERSYKSRVLTSETIIHDHSVSINKSIKSWKTKERIRKQSYLIFLREYLKVSKRKVAIYKYVYEIGKYEKYFYKLLKNRFAN